MNEEEHSRLEEIRPFRKEVRGAGEYLLVGIDIAKDKHHAFFGTTRGKTILRRLVFGNNIEGFRKLLGSARALQDQKGFEAGGFRDGTNGRLSQAVGIAFDPMWASGGLCLEGGSLREPKDLGWALGHG